VNSAAQSYELMSDMKQLVRELEEKLNEKKKDCFECLIADCEAKILKKQQEMEMARQQSYAKLNQQLLELKNLWG